MLRVTRYVPPPPLLKSQLPELTSFQHLDYCSLRNKRPCDVGLKGTAAAVNTWLYTNSPDVFLLSWAQFQLDLKKVSLLYNWKKNNTLFFFLFLHWCCTNLSPSSLTNSGCVSFVLTEYLRGDVLPVEQHAASDLPRLLHPNSHLKALMDRDAPHCVLKGIQTYRC